MIIPVSPPPEPPALIRIERIDERSGVQPDAINPDVATPPALVSSEPSLVGLEPQPIAIVEAPVEVPEIPVEVSVEISTDIGAATIAADALNIEAEVEGAPSIPPNSPPDSQLDPPPDASLTTQEPSLAENIPAFIAGVEQLQREPITGTTIVLDTDRERMVQALGTVEVPERRRVALGDRLAGAKQADGLDPTEPIAAEDTVNEEDGGESGGDGEVAGDQEDDQGRELDRETSNDADPAIETAEPGATDIPTSVPDDSDRDSFSIDADGAIIDPEAVFEDLMEDAGSEAVEAVDEVDGLNLQEPLRLTTPLEVTADEQTFDRDRQIFTAIGNATMRYGEALLEADRIQVNLLTRMSRAEGNVALTRSNGSIIRGTKARYNFAQELGTIEDALGDITTTPSNPEADNQEPRRTVAVPPTTLLPVPIGSRFVADAPQSDRFLEDQPRDVYTPGGFSFQLGTSRDFQSQRQTLGGTGTLTRFRFSAESVDFTPTGWSGNNVRITTDPFSPPESELRADRLTFTPLDPLRDELRFTRPRLVFDDSLALPVLRRRYIIDRGDREPPIITFGFDGRDRDGFFIQRRFSIINTPSIKFEITPQFYAQRALDSDNFFDPANFGFTTELTARLSDRASLAAESSLTTLDLGDLNLDENLRASVRLTQLVLGKHRLTGEYTFRNRQFNGSLGFRTVHSSLGVVLSSPPIALGNTGVVLRYQVGANRINADTDEAELLKPIRENNRVTLMRYQGSFTLDRGWTLWQGEALPATAEEGLRYSPVPVVPYARLFASLRGIAGFYSNGASEASLRGTVGAQAQFGHFSKPFLDYTSVFAYYSEALIDGQSPFQFDRVADQRIFSFGILQQLVGPLRFGFQTVINLDTDEAISTDFILEYSRRTFGIILAINPQRESGSLQLRINDFDWNGNAGAFTNPETCSSIRGLNCDEL